MKAIIVFRMDEEPIGQERKSLGRLKKFNLDNTANLVRNRGAKQISKNVMKLVLRLKSLAQNMFRTIKCCTTFKYNFIS